MAGSSNVISVCSTNCATTTTPKKAIFGDPKTNFDQSKCHYSRVWKMQQEQVDFLLAVGEKLSTKQLVTSTILCWSIADGTMCRKNTCSLVSANHE